MAQIQLYDLLKLESILVFDTAERGVTVTFTNISGSCKQAIESISIEDNLVTKSASLYFKTIGKSADIAFSLIKNIPSGAGMGGGSADAAATLKLLNDHCKLLTLHEMFSLGRKLGADVPFALSGGIALCEGIGEIITSMKGGFKYWVLIVNNGLHIDTGYAYGIIGRQAGYYYDKEALEKRKLSIMQASINGRIDPIKNILINDFEVPVFQKFSELQALKQKLYNLGADFAMMTGSGSTIFGLFSKEKDVEKASCALSGEIKTVIISSFF
jgi:4-diphosphocytidyl-2-C-methyl-D-erythritol kinase